jgi:hypothetical protein
MSDTLVYTVEEAAEISRISRSSIFELIHSHRLRSLQLHPVFLGQEQVEHHFWKPARRRQIAVVRAGPSARDPREGVWMDGVSWSGGVG